MAEELQQRTTTNMEEMLDHQQLTQIMAEELQQRTTTNMEEI